MNTKISSMSIGRLVTRVVLSMAITCTLGGCVRRTITITTEPPNALVSLNNQEIGRSTVTTDFLWYGDYDVVIRKEGYTTLKTHWLIKPPWYQLIPIDFFAEILWPGWFHDRRTNHFELTPRELPSSDELIMRADQARAKAFDLRR